MTMMKETQPTEPVKVTVTNPVAAISLEAIYQASERLKGIVTRTPLMPNLNLSAQFHANILLKREDLQVVRSYKVRGAYNKMCGLAPAELINGVVCASAGNHAQGVAYACH